MTMDELIEKIDITKKAMIFAGPIHRKDLRKHIKRMTAELKQYDRYREEAAGGVNG